MAIYSWYPFKGSGISINHNLEKITHKSHNDNNNMWPKAKVRSRLTKLQLHAKPADDFFTQSETLDVVTKVK
jgi:hypothetical protein